jgi:hypothetical protein
LTCPTSSHSAASFFLLVARIPTLTFGLPLSSMYRSHCCLGLSLEDSAPDIEDEDDDEADDDAFFLPPDDGLLLPNPPPEGAAFSASDGRRHRGDNGDDTRVREDDDEAEDIAATACATQALSGAIVAGVAVLLDAVAVASDRRGCCCVLTNVHAKAPSKEAAAAKIRPTRKATKAPELSSCRVIIIDLEAVSWWCSRRRRGRSINQQAMVGVRSLTHRFGTVDAIFRFGMCGWQESSMKTLAGRHCATASGLHRRWYDNREPKPMF